MVAKQTAEERRRMYALIGIERLIAEQVADVNPDAFEVRPSRPGVDEQVWGTRREPLALHAVTAARRVMLKAQQAEREAIAHARGQGKTWTEIADALGERFVNDAKKADMSLTVAAWQYAAYRVWPGEEVPWSARYSGISDTAHWQCWTCAQYIYESHPDNGPDAEKGHAAGCARLAARKRRGWR